MIIFGGWKGVSNRHFIWNLAYTEAKIPKGQESVTCWTFLTFLKTLAHDSFHSLLPLNVVPGFRWYRWLLSVCSLLESTFKSYFWILYQTDLKKKSQKSGLKCYDQQLSLHLLRLSLP